MSVDDIVQLTIVVSDASLTRPGFGTPLALVSHVPAGWGTNKVRTFSKLSELTTLGFATTDAGYKLASKITSQKPAPGQFKLAKRDVVPTQSIHLQCLSAVAGKVYALSVGINGAATTDLTYTVPGSGSPTTTTVATAIAALISAVVGPAATSGTDTITVTPEVPGDLVNIKNWSVPLFKITDVTADPGISTDLDEALAEDGDWYGALLDSNSKAEIESAAAWIEANGKLFAYNTSDSACYDPASTTDVAYQLKALTYARTFGILNNNETLGYSAAAWIGRGFGFDPGKITWAMKTLVAVTVDKLDTGKQTALEAKNLNFYVTKFGRPITWEGKLSSGEYIDVTHGLDWYDAEMSIQLFETISGLPKLPYTIHGLGLIEATVRAVNKAAIRQGVLADDGNLTVTMPTLDQIDAITKAQRLVPNIEVTGTLQGAVHKSKMTATISH